MVALCAAGGFAIARGALPQTVAAATPVPGATASPAASPSPTGTPVPTPTPAATPVPVTIDKDGFHPAVVRVSPGQSVAWTNADKKPHAATASDGSWDTGQIDPGQSQTLQFFELGKWDYLDGFNPVMHATLIVATPLPGGAQ
ncbi:MAG TPA: cupredoxin domain-containing protein [Candidatus Eremiobacteraceae bacterium]|nr:cupredoxin domain-containing protein [Candidatus Eremiobacteraceae bacterium]